MAKLGKKYLDKSGLSYLWKRIDGRYVHIEDGKTSFADGEIIVGIDGEKGVKGSGVTIGGAKLSETPTAKIVATEKAVAAEVDKINSAIDALGSVMTFLGVTTTPISEGSTNAEVVIGKDAEGKDIKVTASNGDVVIYNTKEGEPEEFIWNGSSWQEIGKVFNDEAITSVTSGSNAIEVNDSDSQKSTGNATVSLKIDDSGEPTGWTAADSGYGHIHLSQDTTGGLKAEYGKEVLTIGDAMDGTEIEQAISNASNISWNGSAWVGGFEDYQQA